ncbi:peptidase M24, structural domain-containing protein [Cokeromyces recurvatus]|uniref:peptidase M24, structural domain-containing protein n=1 Tax=Cokeromyces recurvatus TaxID=90255 RepID=UPI00221EAF33|nr:peptidase M24, structural domain-containing protein [Cokeromyces recurvatus]KAI7900931.1 peptidase M24, structural domain-containing protein [Cokeromyces recurvatus]
MAPHPVNIIPKQHHYINEHFIPTKQHCLKVKKLLLDQAHLDSSSVIYMKGNTEMTRDNTDIDLEFRQESNFFYLTGVDEPGFQLIFHLESEQLYLIAPNIAQTDIFWKGPSHDSQDLLKRYDVDKIITEPDLPLLFSNLQPTRLYLFDNTIQTLAWMRVTEDCIIDYQSLSLALNEARLIKFPWEVNMLRDVMRASSEAHIRVIQQCRPEMREAYLAAVFQWACAAHQHEVYRQAYLPIIASGPRIATLHYSKNNHIIRQNQLVLVDAGGEKCCYGSDITRTFPANGLFSKEARIIYEIVLKMQESILVELKPGVFWTDMERLAISVLCHELIKIGILVGEEEELIQRRVPSAFYYHGLGHSVGLDVHDVGGKDDSTDEDEEKEFLKNRPLEANMVLTVEPGLYFNDTMLSIWTEFPGYQNYFDLNVLAKYREVGGVRIEDTIVITQNGYENLTLVPKTIEAIEELMQATKQHPSSSSLSLS